MAAMGLRAEMIKTLEFIQHDGLLGRIFQYRLPGKIVASPIKHITGCGQSVPARPSGLLVVVLDAFGHGRMDYEANIGAVDAHAERQWWPP